MIAVLLCAFVSTGHAEPYDAATWLERFAFTPPEPAPDGVAAGTIGDLPSFTISPSEPGPALIRISLPFSEGAYPEQLGLHATHGDQTVAAAVRPLTLHPGQPRSIRRAMITFPFDFATAKTHRFEFALAESPSMAGPDVVKNDQGYGFAMGPIAVTIADSVLAITGEGLALDAAVVAPPIASDSAPVVEIIESNAHFLWVRMLQFDANWPRIVEIQADSRGNLDATLHVQRLATGDDFAPELGWRIATSAAVEPMRHAIGVQPVPDVPLDGGDWRIAFPGGEHFRKGTVVAQSADTGATVTYTRCAPADKVPMQEAAWRTAAFAVRSKVPRLGASRAGIDPQNFDVVYGSGLNNPLALHPDLAVVRAYFHHGIRNARLYGDDFGNVTAFNQGGTASVFGMNRLNHGPAIFEAYYRSGKPGLRDVAVDWCANMYDLSIWWGNTEDAGGTRYNNASKDDPDFMWRRNEYSVTFCTKGIDAFFYAWEETGDPRMAVALRNQVAYAKEYVHVDEGECRNIGDVLDFMRLYRFTGVESYRDNALRLFRELRTKLGPDNLFSQGGQPIVEKSPFIDNDEMGYAYPFVKPYIIGYALQGLPELAREFPTEPRLRDTIRAVADFLAESQDPTGGWRYPHPHSTFTIHNQSLEHCAQLVRAARFLHEQGEPIGNLIDAIERSLRAQVNTFMRTGTVLTGITGWEKTTGLLDTTTIGELYDSPEARDPARDYTEGAVGIGSIPPDGLVYFSEVLNFYVEHRPAERLFAMNAPQQAVVERTPDNQLALRTTDGPGEIVIAASGQPDQGHSVRFALPGLPTPPAPHWAGQSPAGSIVYTNATDAGTHTFQIEPHPYYATWSHTLFPNPDVDELRNFAIELNADLSQPVEQNSARWHDSAYTIPSAPGITAMAGDPTMTGGSHAIFRATPIQGTPVTFRGVFLMPGNNETFGREVADVFRMTWSAHPPAPAAAVVEAATYGVRNLAPAFNAARVRRMNFDASWSTSDGSPFETWREHARATYLDCLGPRPPLAPFNTSEPVTEDRGGYMAHKFAFNISASERVKAYLLLPKGQGPFPAVVALHDHGAHFSIGKEKVVRPFDEPQTVIDDATEWTSKYYGGRWIGDELAQRGYVVFATDALFWGDRGRYGGVKYDDQQALGANMLQLGLSWAGKIVWDDIRCAEFVQGLAAVDPDRIACMGLSMGSHRTWSLAAATDIVKAGAAICWMGDTPTLASPGNNQTTGMSAFSMLLPDVRNHLDYPDVASIAAPKPMLFYNGTQDALFPVEGVEAAYKKMAAVWNAAQSADMLTARLWDVPHEFNAAMQDAAFHWLDTHMKPTPNTEGSDTDD